MFICFWCQFENFGTHASLGGQMVKCRQRRRQVFGLGGAASREKGAIYIYTSSMSLLRYGVKYIQKVYSLKKRKQQITMLAYNANKNVSHKTKNNTKYNIKYTTKTRNATHPVL